MNRRDALRSLLGMPVGVACGLLVNPPPTERKTQTERQPQRVSLLMPVCVKQEDGTWLAGSMCLDFPDWVPAPSGYSLKLKQTEGALAWEM